jgi:hypothetical protein
MANRTVLNVSRSELLYQGVIKDPSITRLASGLHLFDTLLDRLSKYGAKPPDIRIEAPGPALTDLNLVCYLTSLSASVRIHLNRIDVLFQDARLLGGPDLAGRIVLDSLDATLEAIQDIVIDSHAITLTCHASLEQAALDNLFSQYVHVPQGTDPILNRGVGYYFGPSGKRKESSLVLDKSVLIPGGLFLKVACVLDGSTVSLQELVTTARDSVEGLLRHFGLELK